MDKDYKKLYEDALERAKYLKENTDSVGALDVSANFEYIFPELKESEDEKIRKGLIKGLSAMRDIHKHQTFSDDAINIDDAIAWLEKQGEQKPTMIQWKGNNLKEVIDFTGVYKEGFEKWFHNSWEEYEQYVHKHNNIFKIFNEDGSHIEVPVGAWIVKTPDGYNTASRYVFRQKLAWSEEDEDALDIAIRIIQNGGDDCAGILDSDKALNWLKSIKPNHWKPSEEQMKALKDIIIGKRGPLYDLYFDLEKL